MRKRFVGSECEGQDEGEDEDENEGVSGTYQPPLLTTFYSHTGKVNAEKIHLQGEVGRCSQNQKNS